MAKKTKREAVAELVSALKTSVPADLRQVAHELLGLWGGHKGMAKKLAQLYEDSEPGGMTRAKIMSDCLNSLRFASDKDGGKEELSLLNEEDLDRTAADMLRKAVDGKVKTQDEFDPDRQEGANSGTPAPAGSGESGSVTEASEADPAP